MERVAAVLNACTSGVLKWNERRWLSTTWEQRPDPLEMTLSRWFRSKTGFRIGKEGFGSYIHVQQIRLRQVPSQQDLVEDQQPNDAFHSYDLTQSIQIHPCLYTGLNLLLNITACLGSSNVKSVMKGKLYHFSCAVLSPARRTPDLDPDGETTIYWLQVDVTSRPDSARR